MVACLCGRHRFTSVIRNERVNTSETVILPASTLRVNIVRARHPPNQVITFCPVWSLDQYHLERDGFENYLLSEPCCSNRRMYFPGRRAFTDQKLKACFYSPKQYWYWSQSNIRPPNTSTCKLCPWAQLDDWIVTCMRSVNFY